MGHIEWSTTMTFCIGLLRDLPYPPRRAVVTKALAEQLYFLKTGSGHSKDTKARLLGSLGLDWCIITQNGSIITHKTVLIFKCHMNSSSSATYLCL